MICLKISNNLHTNLIQNIFGKINAASPNYHELQRIVWLD